MLFEKTNPLWDRTLVSKSRIFFSNIPNQNLSSVSEVVKGLIYPFRRGLKD